MKNFLQTRLDIPTQKGLEEVREVKKTKEAIATILITKR